MRKNSVIVLWILAIIGFFGVSNKVLAGEFYVPLNKNYWSAYSGSGNMTSPYDSELGHRVLKIESDPNSYFIAKYPKNGNADIKQIRLLTKIKTNKTFSLRILTYCDDNKYHWVYYEPGKESITKWQGVVQVKIGEGYTDNKWHDIKRNVDADLFTMFGIHMKYVTQIWIHGSLYVGEMKFKDVDVSYPIEFTISSPEENATIANMYVKIHIDINTGLFPDYVKIKVNGQLYQTYPTSSNLVVPLKKGSNILYITVEDEKPDEYKYGYNSFIVNCDPDSLDISFLAPNDWSFISGQGIISYFPPYFNLGNPFSPLVNYYEVNVEPNNDAYIIITSPILNITKEGLALRIKSSSYFCMFALVKGKDGLNHYIYYYPSNGNMTSYNNNVLCPIGKRYQDGEWHTLILDLEKDLFESTGVHIENVVKIYFYGKKFSFGNVRLLKRFQVPQEYSAIQNAIDTANGGGLVEIGAGVYNQKTIVTKSGIVLMGTNGHNTTPENEDDDTIIINTVYGAVLNQTLGILNPEIPIGTDTVGNQVIQGLVFREFKGYPIIKCEKFSDYLRIVDCKFENNSAMCIYISYSNALMLENCNFIKNTSRVIDMGWNDNSLECYNCNFEENNDNNASLILMNATEAVFKNCVFKNNIFKSTPAYKNSLITGKWGGPHLINCIFENNEAEAILDVNLSGWCNMGGKISNCTFYNNQVLCLKYTEDSLIYAVIDIRDNIIVGNNGGIYIDYDTVNPPEFGWGILENNGVYQIIKNNNVYNNVKNYSGDITDQTGLNGNISVDPLFISGPKGDYYLSQTAAGQAVNSPCVDKGSQTAEEAGLSNYTTRTDNKPDSGIVDMGYHYPVD